MYTGGISEVGWEFDLEGNLWGVGRNEHGDDSRWGSRVFKVRSYSEMSQYLVTNYAAYNLCFGTTNLVRLMIEKNNMDVDNPFRFNMTISSLESKP